MTSFALFALIVAAVIATLSFYASMAQAGVISALVGAFNHFVGLAANGSHPLRFMLMFMLAAFALIAGLRLLSLLKK